MSVLLVGGPGDGQRVQESCPLGIGNRFEVIERPKFGGPLSSAPRLKEAVSFKRHTYRLFMISYYGREYWFGVPDEMSDDETNGPFIFARLIAHYEQGKRA